MCTWSSKYQIKLLLQEAMKGIPAHNFTENPRINKLATKKSSFFNDWDYENFGFEYPGTNQVAVMFLNHA